MRTIQREDVESFLVDVDVNGIEERVQHLHQLREPQRVRQPVAEQLCITSPTQDVVARGDAYSA